MPTPRLLVWLGVAAFLTAAGVVLPAATIAGLGLDVALALGFVVDLLRARRIEVTAERRWPPLLVQGEPAEVAVTASVPRSPRPVEVTLREALAPELAAAPLRTRLRLPSRRGQTWSYRLCPQQRGEHPIGPLDARVHGPWGLAMAHRRLLPPETCRVYPQVRWGGRVGRLLALAHRHELGVNPLRQEGVGDELYGLRPYRPGDPLTRIHWKATARHGRLISREETWELGASLVILLDCSRAMSGTDEGRSKLDVALATALALTRLAGGRGDRVALVAFSDRIERSLRVPRTGKGISQAYTALFGLQATLREPAYELAVEAACDLESRGATVVIFTSVSDLAATETLNTALKRLSRRHRTLLVNLEDAELRRLAESVPATPEAAFAQLASLEIRLANRRLARRLQRVGVHVVSCPSDRLALETFNAYLELVLRAPMHGGAVRLGLRVPA
ncbi:MAG: DUF58 domain-containing protein [Thermoanaerobaculia bacterium]